MVQIPADVLGKEFLWRQVRGAVEFLALFVAVFKVETLDRFAKGQGQHPVDPVEHFLAGLVDPFVFNPVVVNQLTQNYGVVAELVVQDFVDFARLGRVVGFGHCALRYDSVLFNQGDHHVPLTPVLLRGCHQPSDFTVVVGQFSRVDHVFVEVVGLFKFVPEELVGLG